MSWIKRNLSLVISGVLALGMLGFGGWYLWSAIEKNKTTSGEIEHTKKEIERYLNMPVTPSQSNLNAAKRELERLGQFNALARKQFPPQAQPPAPLTSESFKTVLQTTVNDLHQRAGAVGINVEPNYYFTFEAHKGSLEFPPDILRPLYDRLQEVQSISSVLLKSRVNRIVGMRRAMVPGERSGGAPPAGGAGASGSGSGDYLPATRRMYPELAMASWPYEVTFDCFSSQLGGVLEALERIDQGFIIRAPTSEAAPDFATARAAAAQRAGARTTNTAPRGALVTVLDEKQLRVTLHIEVLRPETFVAPGPGGRPPGRPTP